MSLLEVKNIHKTYRIGNVEVRALQGVSLKIEQGEFVAIMGASGSGKSTLMHLLGLLDTPDQGTFHLLGRDVTRLTGEQYAYLRNGIIGFVFQQFNLMSRSTALENVMLPLFYSARTKTPTEQSARRVLARVGLENRMEHKPTELSGGQQQRVAIARALVNEPVLIMADEPTGNLDSKSGREIMDIFKGLHERGLTIVLVTHDEKVAAAASRVIRMQDGEIVEDRRTRTDSAVQSEVLKAEDLERFRRPFSLRELREHIQQSSRMILSNKMRSVLSMLGVLIGVACVITMLALGRGAKESVTEQLSRLGSNLLSVRAGSAKVRGVSLEAGTVTWFTLEDAKGIRETVSGVKAVAPQVQGPATVAYKDRNWSTRVLGTSFEYAMMRNQDPIQGRFFTETEDQSRSRLVLIGQTVMRELFKDEDPVGKIMKVNRMNFQVIGVLPSQGSNSWRDQDDLIVIPLLTAMKRVLGKQYLDEINVEIVTPEEMLTAQDEMQKLIIKNHQLTPDRYETFNVRNYTDIQAAMTGTTQTFSILLGSVAAISLVVGGIGIMNIMLVSVKERTREIGLRKALGATERDILMQFLVESVMITFLGGLAGILCAGSVTWLITAFAKWKTVIGMDSLLLAFFFSVSVGIVFGLWPAKTAARLDPIKALRYE